MALLSSALVVLEQQLGALGHPLAPEVASARRYVDLFRAVHRGGHVRAHGLRGADVAEVVKQYAGKAGLDPAEFAGHSLRAGFVTSPAPRAAPRS
jgi:hypothetical protein